MQVGQCKKGRNDQEPGVGSPFGISKLTGESAGQATLREETQAQSKNALIKPRTKLSPEPHCGWALNIRTSWGCDPDAVPSGLQQPRAGL